MYKYYFTVNGKYLVWSKSPRFDALSSYRYVNNVSLYYFRLIIDLSSLHQGLQQCVRAVSNAQAQCGSH